MVYQNKLDPIQTQCLLAMSLKGFVTNFKTRNLPSARPPGKWQNWAIDTNHKWTTEDE